MAYRLMGGRGAGGAIPAEEKEEGLFSSQDGVASAIAAGRTTNAKGVGAATKSVSMVQVKLEAVDPEKNGSS